MSVIVKTQSALQTSVPSTKPWVEHFAIPRFQECSWASIHNLLPGTTLWINLILFTFKELVIKPLFPGKVRKVRIARCECASSCKSPGTFGIVG